MFFGFWLLGSRWKDSIFTVSVVVWGEAITDRNKGFIGSDGYYDLIKI